MITIIHGEDLTSSRKFLLDKKSKSKDIVEFIAPNIDLTVLMQNTSGSSLFGSEKTILIENLLSGKKSGQLKDIIDHVKENEKNCDFILWEANELSKAFLASFKSATVNIFKLPQTLFSFLEGIKPKNSSNVLLFHTALEGSNEEMLLFMLIRQFRLMLAVLSGSDIDEVKRIAPWQEGKIRKQADLFGEEKLIEAIKKLHKIDMQLKSGQTSLNTIQAVDIFLLSI